MSAKKSAPRRAPAKQKSGNPRKQLPLESDLEDEDKVRLPHVFGVRPGVYLAWIYGFIILAVLFFIFLWPGIASPGGVLVLSSEPWGAALRVDGVYREASPCEVFVPRGKHRLEMVLPGFETWTAEIEVKNRLFASRFFPLKTRIHGELKTSSPARAFREAAGEAAAWSFAGEPAAMSQIPLSLSEGAYRVGPAASDPAVKYAMEETLAASLSFGVTRAALRDLLRAKFLVDNRGLSPSPLGLLGSAGDILSLLDKNPASSAWLADLLEGQGESSSLIEASSWYGEESGAASSPAALNAPPVPGNTAAIGETVFVEIPAGKLARGSSFPKELEIETFFIAENEISRALWELFLEERPEWRPENTAALTESGLVSGDYLKEVILPGAPSRSGDSPVTSISWHAAAAFCEWYGSTLPPSYPGWEARLPSEAEWEYAAGALPRMLGNHWEWCADYYRPLDFFPASAEHGPASPERSLRGGSWVNPPDSVNAGTRASLPPETCSVFVSFRPVLARKRALP